MTERARLHQELLRSQAFLEQTNTLAKVGGWELALDTNTLSWTRETHLIHGVPEDFDPNVGAALSFYPEPGRTQLQSAMARCAADGATIDLTLRAVTAAGERSSHSNSWKRGAAWCSTWTTSRKSTTPRAMPMAIPYWWSSWRSCPARSKKTRWWCAWAAIIVADTIKRADMKLYERRRRERPD